MNTGSEMSDNRAFVSYRGYFIDGDYLTDNPASPPVDQLLGVNDHNVAVGFGTDASNGRVVAFLLRRGGQVTILSVPGSSMTQALGINDRGQPVGFYTDANGNTDGLLATPVHHHRD